MRSVPTGLEVERAPRDRPPVHGQRDVATSAGRELDAHNGQAIVEREDGAVVASPRRFVRVSRAAAQLEVPSELTGPAVLNERMGPPPGCENLDQRSGVMRK